MPVFLNLYVPSFCCGSSVVKHETGRAGTDWLKEFAAKHSFVLFQQCFHLLSAGDEYNAVIRLIWKHCFVLSFNQVFTLTGSCVLLFCLWLSMLTHPGKNETFESNLWNERIPAVTCVISALLFNSVGTFLRDCWKIADFFYCKFK